MDVRLAAQTAAQKDQNYQAFLLQPGNADKTPADFDVYQKKAFETYQKDKWLSDFFLTDKDAKDNYVKKLYTGEVNPDAFATAWKQTSWQEAIAIKLRSIAGSELSFQIDKNLSNGNLTQAQADYMGPLSMENKFGENAIYTRAEALANAPNFKDIQTAYGCTTGRECLEKAAEVWKIGQDVKYGDDDKAKKLFTDDPDWAMRGVATGKFDVGDVQNLINQHKAERNNASINPFVKLVDTVLGITSNIPVLGELAKLERKVVEGTVTQAYRPADEKLARGLAELWVKSNGDKLEYDDKQKDDDIKKRTANVAAQIMLGTSLDNLTSGVDAMDNLSLLKKMEIHGKNSIQSAYNLQTNAVAQKEYIDKLDWGEKNALDFINWTAGSAIRGHITTEQGLERTRLAKGPAKDAEIIAGYGEALRGTVMSGGKLYGTLAAFAVPTAGLVGGVAAGTTAITGQTLLNAVGTSMGQYLAGESIGGTAEACSFKSTMDGAACGRSALMSGFMIISAGQGGAAMLNKPAAVTFTNAVAKAAIPGGPGVNAITGAARSVARLEQAVAASVPVQAIERAMVSAPAQLGLNGLGIAAFGLEAGHVCGTEGVGVNCAIQAGFTTVTALRFLNGGAQMIAAGQPPGSTIGSIAANANKGIQVFDTGVNGLLAGSACTAALAGLAPGESCGTAIMFLTTAGIHTRDAFKPGGHPPETAAKVGEPGKKFGSVQEAGVELGKLIDAKTGKVNLAPGETRDITFTDVKGETKKVTIKAGMTDAEFQAARDQLVHAYTDTKVAFVESVKTARQVKTTVDKKQPIWIAPKTYRCQKHSTHWPHPSHLTQPSSQRLILP